MKSIHLIILAYTFWIIFQLWSCNLDNFHLVYLFLLILYWFTIFTYSPLLNYMPEKMSNSLILNQITVRNHPCIWGKKSKSVLRAILRMVKRILNLESEDLGLTPSSVILLLCDLDKLLVNALFLSINENHPCSIYLKELMLELN